MKKYGYLLITLFIVGILSGCAELFQGKVSMNTNLDNAGSLKDLFSPKDEITKLTSPTQFYVASSYSANDIKLSWNAVGGAASYQIERAVMEPGNISYESPGDEHFDVLMQFVYGTSYTDRILSEAQHNSPEYKNKYYYRVYAENVGKGYESSDPTETLGGILFPPPSGVTASLGTDTNSITVNWDKVENASSYTIYRSNYATGVSPYFIGKVYGNQTRYTDFISDNEQGIEYYYTVHAVNSYGNSSAAGNLAMGYARMAGAPDKPGKVTLPDGSGQGNSTTEIQISWPASSVDGAAYAVYRYSSEDASLTRLVSGLTGTSYTDTSPKTGLYYHYQVQTVIKNAEGVEIKSQLSDPIEAFILSPPSAVAVEKEGDVISIIWYPAIGSEKVDTPYQYAVYGGNSLSNISTLVASVGSNIRDDGYISSGPVAAHTFYAVRTLNASLESAQSMIVSPPPAAARIQDATRAANLSDDDHDYQANSSGVYPVRITWMAPQGETPAAYHVYRSSSPTSGFRKISGDNPIPASDADLSGIFTYIDENSAAKAGKLFYYRVLSLNVLGQGSFFSEIKTGYGALTYEQYMLEYNKTVKSSHKKLKLMHKANDMDKLGSETAHGTINGYINYNAKVAGLGADITMYYNNYADFYIDNDSSKGIYFSVTGNTNTSANMSANGSMSGTMTCTGMYPGKVYYNNIEIKGGGAAGGTYGIEPEGFDLDYVSWMLGEQ
ncbi:hypothetical protein LJC14_07445 [Treponema sp. OttesenSCG-928-L16]|nr:hypothetical protein [Treponema sp. OttesenSCG-928-L16]